MITDSPCGAAWWQWTFAWRTYSVCRDAPLCSLLVRNICLDGLYRPVRLCPPLSSCPSILRSSVCFSPLLTSHRRRHGDNHEEHKGGGSARVTTIDECTRWRTLSSLPFLSFPLLSPFFASVWRLPLARGTILLSYIENEVFSSATGTSRVNFLGVSCFVFVFLSLSFSLYPARARARLHSVPPCARKLQALTPRTPHGIRRRHGSSAIKSSLPRAQLLQL